MSEKHSGAFGSFSKLFTKSVRGFDSPRQLAMGLALGAVMGILPKENLLVVALLVFLVVSVSNLVTGAIACALMTFLSPHFESVFHVIGQFILENEIVAQSISRWFDYPLVAWTRLDNSVVCGGLATGLSLFLPVYLTSFHFFNRFRSAIETRLLSSRFVNWLLGYTPFETQR